MLATFYINDDLDPLLLWFIFNMVWAVPALIVPFSYTKYIEWHLPKHFFLHSYNGPIWDSPSWYCATLLIYLTWARVLDFIFCHFAQCTGPIVKYH